MISLCPKCYCMTKTIIIKRDVGTKKAKVIKMCGKCGHQRVFWNKRKGIK